MGYISETSREQYPMIPIAFEALDKRLRAALIYRWKLSMRSKARA